MSALAVAVALSAPLATLLVVVLFACLDAEDARPWTTRSACDRRCMPMPYWRRHVVLCSTPAPGGRCSHVA